jgi:hypothetical protein
MDMSFAIFGAQEKSSMGMTWKTLEDPRTIIITRPGTKPTRFHSFVKEGIHSRHDSLSERIEKWH